MKKLAAILLGACLLHASSAWAEYPDRMVRIVVPVAPGGSLDTVGRMVADYLRTHLKGSFVVENKPGANTEIGAGFVSQSPPDGYTLLVNSDALISVSILSANKSIHPVNSFSAISMIVSSPGVLVVRPDLGTSTIQDFVSTARSKRLSVGTTGTGTGSHFLAMMFRHETSLEWTDVPYKGSGPAINDLLGGHVDAVWSMAAPILPHIKAGKMTALAVSSKRRSPQLPDVPTIDESMVPNFVVDNWVGIFAPAGTPPAIVNMLSKSISNMVKDPTQRKKLVELGFEPVGSDPATLSTQVGSSLEKWKSIAERIGMTK